MDEDVRRYYEGGVEQNRLSQGSSLIEFIRTKELLDRFMPPPPADVLDVGGGPGEYAAWLADRGYTVRLVDATPLHVAQAAERAAHRFEAREGEATALEEADAAFDVVLLLGPLYHLHKREDRLAALREARRVLRPGGLLAAAAISRFASLLDTLVRGSVRDRAVWPVVEHDLAYGRHVSPVGSHLFTTAYFHLPMELREEVQTTDFELEAIFGLEGPGWLRIETLDDESTREDVLHVARAVETEPSLLGASAHLLAIGRS
jgi:SAM-dependent methyltransferase